jgi:hypothetical protein
MKTKLKVLSEINRKKKEISECSDEHLLKLKEELKKLEEELTKYRK